MTLTPKQAIDELLARFFINNPDIDSLEALLDSVNRAGYWYMDVMQEKLKKAIPHVGDSLLKELNIPVTRDYLRTQAIQFIVGACVLNEAGDKVLIVYEIRGSSHVPGLPKGKLSKGESMEQGAVREVFEETNIDITNEISSDERIENIEPNGRGTCCFIVRGVRESVDFKTHLRGEVARVTWMPIPDFLELVDAGKVSQWFDFRNPKQKENLKFWAKLKEHLAK